MAVMRRFASNVCSRSEPNAAPAPALMDQAQSNAPDFPGTVHLPSPVGE